MFVPKTVTILNITINKMLLVYKDLELKVTFKLRKGNNRFVFNEKKIFF